MIPLANPTSIYEEDFHRHEFYAEDGTHLATIEFDDIDDEGSGKLFCEVTAWVRVGSSSDMPAVAFERANLLTKGNHSTGLKSIIAKLDNTGLNWEQGFDVATYMSITAYRTESSEGGWMNTRKGDGVSPYLLRPFIINNGVTLLYGSHGSNKSMLAMRWALGVANGEGYNGEKPARTGPVLYVDFEDTPEPHEIRLTAMAEGVGMEVKDFEGLIWHERVTKNLKDARRRLKRIIRDNGMVLVVIDSIGLARASDVSGSEATIKLFKMFGQLGISVLALDHLSKEDNKRVATGNMDYREATPIGSQFTQSSARLAWFISIMPQSTAKLKSANLYNTKYNHTPEHPPVGMTIALDWDSDDNIVKAEFEIAGSAHDAVVAELGKKTKPQELLLWHYTQQGENKRVIPMTSKALEQSGISGSTIRSAVTENPWWEQMDGSKEYTLSTLGLEAATYFSSMYGQTGTNEEGWNG